MVCNPDLAFTAGPAASFSEQPQGPVDSSSSVVFLRVCGESQVGATYTTGCPGGSVVKPDPTDGWIVRLKFVCDFGDLTKNIPPSPLSGSGDARE